MSETERVKLGMGSMPPDYYDRGVVRNPIQRIWHSWKWHTLRALSFDLSGVVLDVGCAGGMITERIHALSPESFVIGLDLSEDALRYGSHNRPQLAFLCSDAHDLALADDTVDVVITTETVEHLVDPARALREMWRVLRPGGILIVGQDSDSLAFRMIWKVWLRFAGKVWDGAHLSPMKPPRLAATVEAVGFRADVVTSSHLGLEFFVRATAMKDGSEPGIDGV